MSNKLKNASWIIKNIFIDVKKTVLLQSIYQAIRYENNMFNQKS